MSENLQADRAATFERIKTFRATWDTKDGEAKFFGSLIYDAVRWTPEAKSFKPVHDLIARIESGDLTDFMDLRKALVAADFCVMPQALANAVRELGEDRYQRMRRGESLEDDE